jgi:heptosyltransferase-1
MSEAFRRILIVRLGAMGDIIHTLPAASSLRASFPDARISWAVEPRWTPLLEDNPHIDRVVVVRRDAGHLFESLRKLRAERYDLAIDFQGLIKSAIVGRLSGAARLIGYVRREARERAATFFYSKTVETHAGHVVDKRLDLARAAGASKIVRIFPLPRGHAEGELPAGDFVLASPLAGWGSKHWPREYYLDLAARLREGLGIPLVVNGPPNAADELREISGAIPHVSGIAGLIHATRRATAVVGVDSGPLHLAAALKKPGVAIFGPTDPGRNGPYGDSLCTLRAPGAETTYQRGRAPADSMWRVEPALVFDALKAARMAR